MKPTLFGPGDGFLRRTIGFRKEVVEDSAEQEPFSVTGGVFVSPERTMERAWEDATCRHRGRKASPSRSR